MESAIAKLERLLRDCEAGKQGAATEMAQFADSLKDESAAQTVAKLFSEAARDGKGSAAWLMLKRMQTAIWL